MKNKLIALIILTLVISLSADFFQYQRAEASTISPSDLPLMAQVRIEIRPSVYVMSRVIATGSQPRIIVSQHIENARFNNDNRNDYEWGVTSSVLKTRIEAITLGHADYLINRNAPTVGEISALIQENIQTLVNGYPFWTRSPAPATDEDDDNAYFIYTDGSASYGTVTITFSIRPVFNLKSDSILTWNTSGYYEVNMNQLPTLSLTQPSNNLSISEINGYNSIPYEVTVKDDDIGDTLNLQFRHNQGGFTDNWQTINTIVANAANQSLSGTIPISNLPSADGNYKIEFRVIDNKNGTSTSITKDFKIDKTAPNLFTPAATATSTTSISVTGFTTDNLTGLDTNPYNYQINAEEYTGWQAENTKEHTNLQPNTQYEFTMQARDKVGNIRTSNKINKYTLALDPVNFKIVETTNNSISISFDHAAGQGENPEYYLELKLKGTGSTGANIQTSNYTSDKNRIFNTLAENTEYELWVTTRNNDNIENSKYLAMESLKTNTPPSTLIQSPLSNIVLEVNTDFKLEGKAWDIDGDEITIKATVNGIEKTATVTAGVITEPGSTNWELEWTWDELIEGTLTNISITTEDEKGGIKTTVWAYELLVDKTAPIVDTFTIKTDIPEIIETTNPDPNRRYQFVVSDDSAEYIPYLLKVQKPLSEFYQVYVDMTGDFSSELQPIPADIEVGYSGQVNYIQGIDREKTLYLKVISGAKNETITQSAITIFRNLRPNIDLITENENRLATQKPIFTISASDADSDNITNAEIKIFIDSTEQYSKNINLSGTSPFIIDFNEFSDWTLLAESKINYTAKITIFDEYNLASQSSTEFFVIDTRNINAPGVVIIGDPNGVDNPLPVSNYSKAPLTFTYTTDKTMSNRLIVTDDQNYEESTLVKTIKNSSIEAAGTYVTTWDGTDETGELVLSGIYRAYLISNDGANEKVFMVAKFEIDHDKPGITDNSLKTHFNAPGIELNYDFTDIQSKNNVTVDITINGDPYSPIITDEATKKTLIDTYMPTTEGEYVFRFTITDEAGNQTIQEDIKIFDITPADAISVIYPTSTNQSNIDIRVRADDLYGIAKIIVNGIETTNITSVIDNTYQGIVTIPLAKGNNNINISIYDNAGNIINWNSIDEGEPGISYVPPVIPSDNNNVSDDEDTETEKQPTKQPSQQLIDGIVGLPKDVKIIDLREQYMTNTDTDNSSKTQVVSSHQNGSSNISISIRPDDFVNIDYKKALDEAGLTNVLNDLESYVSIKHMLFEDAIGLRFVVIGKDGSVNELFIDIPMLATYEITEPGIDINEWGVFKLNEWTGKWEMIPSYAINENTLEARIGNGIYKPMKMQEPPIDLSKTWAERELKILYNMGIIELDDKYNPYGLATMNSILNSFDKTLNFQDFQQLVTIADQLNLYKSNLNRQEFFVLANNLIQTELQVTLRNAPGDIEISKAMEFGLNKDTAKLETFIDYDDIYEHYKEELAVATNYNFLIGRKGHLLAVNDLVTNQEMAIAFYRYLYFYQIMKYEAMK